MDIDLKGVTSNKESLVLKQIDKILSHPVNPDGIVFDASSLKADSITDDSEYSGLRIRFLGFIGAMRIPMQLDIGFGDVVTPNPIILDYPVLLDFPAPKLLCYNMESVIAEKVEAMISLGRINSRMKDFYDIWFLASHNHFSLRSLTESIVATLNNRGTELPDMIEAFTEEFIDAKRSQWQAFIRRSKLYDAPEDFSVIMSLLIEFLTPVLYDLNEVIHENNIREWNLVDGWK